MNEISNQKTQEVHNPPPIGVGGWLLLFILLITIITPSNFIASFIRGTKINILSDFLLADPKGFIISSIVGLLAVCFGIYAGIALWKIKQNALRIVQVYLYAMIGIVVIETTIKSLILYNEIRAGHLIVNPTFDEILLPGLFGIVWFSVWIVYCKKSKRVKATYRV